MAVAVDILAAAGTPVAAYRSESSGFDRSIQKPAAWKQAAKSEKFAPGGYRTMPARALISTSRRSIPQSQYHTKQQQQKEVFFYSVISCNIESCHLEI